MNRDKRDQQTRFPTVLQETVRGNVCELLCRIDPEIIYFSGHFDAQPVLPGVAQLEWAVTCAVTYLQTPDRFGGMESVKFQAPILPAATVVLAVEWLPEKHKLKFAYRSPDGHHQHASGVISLFPLAAQRSNRSAC